MRDGYQLTSLRSASEKQTYVDRLSEAIKRSDLVSIGLSSPMLERDSCWPNERCGEVFVQTSERSLVLEQQCEMDTNSLRLKIIWSGPDETAMVRLRLR
jgi:hypothetical protein